MKTGHEEEEEARARRSLRKAVIVFAVVEALVLIPVVLYLIFR
jgi:hypothetical protein